MILVSSGIISHDLGDKVMSTPREISILGKFSFNKLIIPKMLKPKIPIEVPSIDLLGSGQFIISRAAS